MQIRAWSCQGCHGAGVKLALRSGRAAGRSKFIDRVPPEEWDGRRCEIASRGPTVIDRQSVHGRENLREDGGWQENVVASKYCSLCLVATTSLYGCKVFNYSSVQLRPVISNWLQDIWCKSPWPRSCRRRRRNFQPDIWQSRIGSSDSSDLV